MTFPRQSRRTERLEGFPSDPAADLGLAGLMAAFRSGKTNSEAITHAYLQRIERIDPAIGSYLFVNPDALKEAREIDRKRATGIDQGPLMGIPVAIKQIFSVTGLPSSPASAIDVRKLIPAEGPFVATLKRAGAIILGLTRTTEFAAATINTTTPAPWNPWDAAVKRVCGGSSHGSAAAQAAGLCAYAIGSDTGGSVRFPAAMCGVVGFKPTCGRWPTEGVFTLSPTFDTVGVFANTAQDVQFISDSLGPLRIATSVVRSGPTFVYPREFTTSLDGSVRTAFDRSLERLQTAGVTVVPIDLPEVAEVASVFGRILPAELIRFVGRDFIESNHDKLDPVVWARVEGELQTSPAELDRLRQRHVELVSIVDKKIRGFDAVIGPTTPITPSPAADLAKPEAAIEWNRVSASYTRPGNLFGMCGISLPVMSANQMPAGIQLLCLAGQDEKLLGLAGYVESILGRCEKPDVSGFEK
jgi:aspartyl-tRNA(Asn)/glutamyl-tRNA(Gln) amidotransferase subunit A